jgi:hypothetical protein
MGVKSLGTTNQTRIGIGMRSPKKSKGQGRVVRKLEEGRGEGEWVTWEQEKGSRRVMSVVQTIQCPTICSSYDILLMYLSCNGSCTRSTETEDPGP